MEKIKALIVEDNMMTAKDISGCLEMEGFHIVAITGNGEDAVKLACEHRPDIAILDIGLGEGKMDGIEVAKRIHDYVKLPVIFLTAYADKVTIKRASEALPASYLVKPVNDAQLLASVHIAMQNFASSSANHPADGKEQAPDYFFNNNFLFVKTDRFVKVDTENIVMVEASGNYVNVVTPQHKYAILSPLNAFYDQIQTINPGFARIHRSYIINLSHLDSFDHLHAMIGDLELPIGKSFRDEFFRKVGYRK
jgi:DNA-binding LytR/AlgR family response regulator